MICFKKTILIEIEILIDFDDIKIGKCYIHTNKIYHYWRAREKIYFSCICVILGIF